MKTVKSVLEVLVLRRGENLVSSSTPCCPRVVGDEARLPMMFTLSHPEKRLCTYWEGWTGKYLTRGHGVRTERSAINKSPYEGRTRSWQVRTAFSGPASAIAYGPHTGIFSIVLQ